jgi:uroporphyrinogen decarboxylase
MPWEVSRMNITSRERVLMTLDGKPVDRPPVDLGSTPNTTICRIAYENLKSKLEMPHVQTAMLGTAFQTVQVDEEILSRLKIDTRGVFPDVSDVPEVTPTEGGGFIDDWGIRFMPAKDRENRIMYYDMVEHPLSGATSVSDITNFQWPNPCRGRSLRGLREKGAMLRDTTRYALVGHPGDTAIFEACWCVRGMREFFVDLIMDRRMAETLLEKVLEIQCARYGRYLDCVGEYLDVVAVGDDLGGQTGPLISREMYQSLIKPYHKRYFEFIKSKTSARLKLHSCGAIEPLLDDLIDVGVDIINPIQVSATGMEPKVLKRRYGDRIAFWGGIDTQNVLPQGTPEDVRSEVLTRIREFGIDGRYVISAVHNIQADVPPENIIALFDTATNFSWKEA